MSMASVVYSLLCILVVVDWNPTYVTSIDSTVVRTTAGTVTGSSSTVLGREIYVFLGIPYAEPPVGELRFQKPQAVQPWTGSRSATTISRPCVQSILNPYVLFNPFEILSVITNSESEDCLYINVWTPKGSVGKDVIVWIHAGGFIGGSSTADDGPMLSAFTDVVVVSLNYRLGMLGFSYFGTDDINGNMGFFDQVLALQWVKANIEAFGGNPDSVTITGLSAGGAATTALLVSPMARGLFKNVVAMSGTTIAAWATYSRKSALTLTRGAASTLGCREATTENSSQNISSSVIRCLRNLSTSAFRIYGFEGRYFGPAIDGDFFPYQPADMLRSGLVNFTGNLLIGTTTQEGSTFLISLYPQYFHLVGPTYITRPQFAEIILDNFQNESQTNRQEIQSIYTYWESPDDGFRNTQLAVDFFGDLQFVCPAKSFAAALSDHGANVYVYSFVHRTYISPVTLLPPWTGVIHGADYEYWFGRRNNDILGFMESEKDLSRRMMTSLANFARTGDPSIPNFVWRPFTNSTDQYVVLDVGSYTTRVGLRSRQCEFWNFRAPNLGIGQGSPIIYREF